MITLVKGRLEDVDMPVEEVFLFSMGFEYSLKNENAWTTFFPALLVTNCNYLIAAHDFELPDAAYVQTN